MKMYLNKKFTLIMQILWQLLLAALKMRFHSLRLCWPTLSGGHATHLLAFETVQINSISKVCVFFSSSFPLFYGKAQTFVDFLAEH
jgi:hypothetical protein